jgi:hypothetical protein
MEMLEGRKVGKARKEVKKIRKKGEEGRLGRKTGMEG